MGREDCRSILAGLGKSPFLDQALRSDTPVACLGAPPALATVAGISTPWMLGQSMGILFFSGSQCSPNSLLCTALKTA